jgi:hypothetical protein
MQGSTPRDWVDYFQALLTPAIALLGILIAWFQWRTNHNRLKVERFKEKFTRFEATRKLLQSIIKRGDLSEEDRLAFLTTTVGSRFLFDDKIADFLDELHSKAVDLQTGNEESRQGPEGTRANKAREHAELMRWFIAQLRGLEKRFARYF